MKEQELLMQEQMAFCKYREYDMKGKKLLAKYWYKKWNKLTNMVKLAAALTKREIKANGITKLNITRI
jgi:hypothetical protein